jgi:hypothetical protein
MLHCSTPCLQKLAAAEVAAAERMLKVAELQAQAAEAAQARLKFEATKVGGLQNVEQRNHLCVSN